MYSIGLKMHCSLEWKRKCIERSRLIRVSITSVNNNIKGVILRDLDRLEEALLV